MNNLEKIMQMVKLQTSNERVMHMLQFPYTHYSIKFSVATQLHKVKHVLKHFQDCSFNDCFLKTLAIIQDNYNNNYMKSN